MTKCMHAKDYSRIIVLALYLWVCLFTTWGTNLAEVNISLALSFALYGLIRAIAAV